jgi:hypothetical protein
MRALVCGILLALSGLGVTGCGSSSSSSSTSRSTSSTTSSAVTSASTTTTSSPAVAPSHVERALLATRSTPRVTLARCRQETAAQRARSPFGATAPLVYACALRRGGAEAAYNVQVLPSGCFVAERHRRGAAIYGCGVRR